MLAVIKTGGKQYLVSPGKKIKIEKLGKIDGEITFDQVLLLQDDKKTEIGNPLVAGSKVVGKILRQGKAAKVISLRYKAKKRVRVKKGHRQQFTEVEIINIVS